MKQSPQSNFDEQPPRRRICTSRIVPLLLLWMLPAGLGLMLTGRVTAQFFTTLYNFSALSNSTNSDGRFPSAGLVLSGNTLYGTAADGGTNGNGTVFAVNTDGTAFEVLHSFTALAVPFIGTNSDGANPYAGLILSGNTLYGTTTEGGTNGNGTVFAVHTNGTGFTTLHSFNAYLGDANPAAGLVLLGNTLYGTTTGGNSENGTVFKVNTDGTGFTNLYSFNGSSDGANPYAGLVLSGNTLYGTAAFGGTNGSGTVFAVNTDGTRFTTLHSFTGGSDGAIPNAGLILTNNTLYGTACSAGGGLGNGTVFAVNTDGTGFTTLHSFTGGSDGAYLYDALVLSGNTLYGTAAYGGTNDSGTVFSVFIQPQLTLLPSGPYIILTWPTNYTGFTLQSTTNLGSSAVWTTNSSPPVVIGGQNVVINTTTSGKQQFYRLIQ